MPHLKTKSSTALEFTKFPYTFFTSGGRRQGSGGVLIFRLDILQWQIWPKNVDEQITPMLALPLQTTLLTHSGTLQSGDLKVMGPSNRTLDLEGPLIYATVVIVLNNNMTNNHSYSCDPNNSSLCIGLSLNFSGRTPGIHLLIPPPPNLLSCDFSNSGRH